MKRLMQVTAAALLALAVTAFAQEPFKAFKLWAGDFSDSALMAAAASGQSCADWLEYLQSPAERYKLKAVAGMQGPPGVVYTLANNDGEVAILKCGTSGSHEEGGGGGE